MTRTIDYLREAGALLEGHFLLSSGRHSDKYFQCARLFQYPDRAEAVMREVAAKIPADFELEVLAGPALGGILPAYELARVLGNFRKSQSYPVFFTERDTEGAMALRRGFEVRPGMRVLIVEDVITTGKSSMEAAAVLEALGAEIAGFACVVDRRVTLAGQGDLPSQDSITYKEGTRPFFAACRVEAGNWDAADCALCKAGIPVVKPGSRVRV
jgi:orotate phosphoribosyltransferase